jgi:parvulin-like peptidyl-prolyl isomerase
MALKKITKTTKPAKTVTNNEVVETNILSETQPRSSSKPYLFIVIGFLIVAGFFGKQYIVAAMVNNKPILRLSVIKELEKQGGQQALDSLITQELIKQEAAKKKIVINNEDVNKKIAELDAQFKAQGQTLDKILEQQGLTRVEIKDQLKVQIMLEKLIGDKLTVSEKEVDAAYEQQKEVFAKETDMKKVRTTIKETLKSQKLSTEAQTLIQGLKKDAKINQLVSF